MGMRTAAVVLVMAGASVAFSPMMMCDPSNKPSSIQQDPNGASRRSVLKGAAATGLAAAALELAEGAAKAAPSAQKAVSSFKNSAPVFEFVEKGGKTGIEVAEGLVESASWEVRGENILQEVLGKLGPNPK